MGFLARLLLGPGIAIRVPEDMVPRLRASGGKATTATKREAAKAANEGFRIADRISSVGRQCHFQALHGTPLPTQV